MAAAVLEPPIEFVIKRGMIAANVSRLNGLPKIALPAWYCLPRLIRGVNSYLDNPRLERLTFDEATRLYKMGKELERQAHLGLQEVETQPYLVRLFLRRWRKSVEQELDTFGDILEALAWAADPHLRGAITDCLAEAGATPDEWSVHS